MLVFKTSAFNRSATPPAKSKHDFIFASAKIELFYENVNFSYRKN